jgi:hypothetical protein
MTAGQVLFDAQNGTACTGRLLQLLPGSLILQLHEAHSR